MKEKVYFSGLLPERFPTLWKELENVLKKEEISYGLLPHTKDIWCRDYMPVWRTPEVYPELNFYEEGNFVRFKFAPSYLKSPRWKRTITDSAKVCRAIGLTPKVWDIVLDGGNVVRCGSRMIMTERVLKENPRYERRTLHAMLKDILNTDHLIFIPEEPEDIFGHADGCIRFVALGTVLINEAVPGNRIFERRLRRILEEYGLNWIEMPCFIDQDRKNRYSAVGNYMNFLETPRVIVAPSYAGFPEQNRRARDILKRAFPRKKIAQVESTELAKEGGVLNCISWER